MFSDGDVAPSATEAKPAPHAYDDVPEEDDQRKPVRKAPPVPKPPATSSPSPRRASEGDVARHAIEERASHHSYEEIAAATEATSEVSNTRKSVVMRARFDPFFSAAFSRSQPDLRGDPRCWFALDRFDEQRLDVGLGRLLLGAEGPVLLLAVRLHGHRLDHALGGKGAGGARGGVERRRLVVR
jgi:hypothetical protein